MRREERFRADDRTVRDVLYDGPGDRQPVEGRRSPSDLVQDEQRSLRGVAEDIRDGRDESIDELVRLLQKLMK